MKPVLAITVGEPAGIGPEISLRCAWQLRQVCMPVLVGDLHFLSQLANQIDPAITLTCIDHADQLKNASHSDHALTVLHSPLSVPVEVGRCDARNGKAILATLDLAIDGAQQGYFDAIVTAPLQKSTINDAGIPFSGHTEYLAERTGTPRVVMMLASPKTATSNRPLRVALATTHLPLRDVADAIHPGLLDEIMTIIADDLCGKFGIDHPVILVAGLNPHAGENGYLGREELDIIGPAIEAAKLRGIDARGPYPADTLFQDKYLDQADCVLAMYHDQGLPVLKYTSFGTGVNITLGLPIIRTSVDHGTALDVAKRGLGLADTGSMLAAIEVALDMVNAVGAVSGEA